MKTAAIYCLAVIPNNAQVHQITTSAHEQTILDAHFVYNKQISSQNSSIIIFLLWLQLFLPFEIASLLVSCGR